MIYFLSGLFLITAIGAAWRSRNRGARGLGDVIENIIPFYMFAFVGLAGVLAFYGHIFQADEVADAIGWPTGNPFQFEVAMANLAYGAAGLLCLRLAGGFRWATAIFTAVFLWGAAYGHIYQFLVNDNRHPDNIGPVLYLDIFVPLILLGLLTYDEVRRRRQAQGQPAAGREAEVRRAA